MDDKRKPRRHSRSLGIAALLALAGGVLSQAPAIARRFQDGDAQQESQGARIARIGSTVRALARLEPANGLLAIGVRPGARIEQLVVGEGQSVKAGDLLLRLEGSRQAEAQLAAAEARQKSSLDERARRRKLTELERGRADRLSKATMDAATRASTAAVAHFQKLLDTSKNLPAQVSLSDRGMLENAIEQARQQEIEATFKQQQASIQVSEMAAQRAIEDEALAEGGSIDAALEAEVAVARAQLDLAVVKAPTDGVILKLLAHVGEVSQGPVLYLADTSAMVARAEVDQSDIPRLSIGDAATVAIGSEEIGGRVTRIGRMVAVNRVVSPDPRARQDHRVIDVTVALESSDVAERFVNMQVEVAIEPTRSSQVSNP